MTILYTSPIASALPVEDVRARTPAAPSGDYSAFVRRTTCDSASGFNFQGLPNGAWYVITVAKAIGGRAPVRLQYSREDDMGAGLYRPMVVHAVKAGLDVQGRIASWQHTVVGQSILKGTAFEKVMVRSG